MLQPLPSLRLQIGAPSVLRKVDRLSCIRYASARYSVPTRLIGTSVAVVIDHGAVCILEPATAMIVAEHELTAPGAPRSWIPTTTGRGQHRSGGHARKPDREAILRPGRRPPSLPGRRGPRQHPIWLELEVLLALGAAHGEQALVSALHRAVAFRRFRAADVRSILAAGSGAPQPRPAGDALILDLPVAPTRSLDAYKITPVIDGGARS